MRNFHAAIILLLLACHTSLVSAQVKSKITLAKKAQWFKDHRENYSVRKRLTIHKHYTDHDTFKVITFNAGGCTIKSVITESNTIPDETTFFVNGKMIRIFDIEDSSKASRQDGCMNIVSGNEVEAYIYTYKQEKYLRVAAHAEKACGRFYNISYYYFLPLTPGNNTGFLFNDADELSFDYEDIGTEAEPDTTKLPPVH